MGAGSGIRPAWSSPRRKLLLLAGSRTVVPPCLGRRTGWVPVLRGVPVVTLFGGRTSGRLVTTELPTRFPGW